MSSTPKIPQNSSIHSSSSHTLPKLHPITSTPSLTSTSLVHPQPQPYMVALSGWPEPIYVSQRTLSRPTSPRSLQNPSTSLSGTTRDPRSAVSTPTITSGPKESEVYGYDTDGFPHSTTRHPDQLTNDYIPRASQVRRATRSDILDHWHDRRFQGLEGDREELSEREDEDEDGPFPTSSTRGTPHPSPPSSSRTIPLPFPPRGSRLSDPRYAPHTSVLHNRPALPLVPTWVNAPSSPMPKTSLTQISTPSTVSQERTPSLIFTPTSANEYTPTQTPPSISETVPTLFTKSSSPASALDSRRQVNHQFTGGRRGSGTLAIRTALDVDPSIGPATEVYPRDPETAVLSSRQRKHSEEAPQSDIKMPLKS